MSSPVLRYPDRRRARQIGAGNGRRRGLDLVRRSLGNNLPAVGAGARSHVYDVVGGADGLLIVFHDEDGISQIPEPRQGIEEAAVVALVKPDARLVEDIEHTDEGGTDLRGQADALPLAAGEGRGATVEAEIPEPYMDHESQALPDLLQDLFRDERFFLGERQVGKERAGLIHAHTRHVVNAQTGDLHGEGFLAESAAAAVLAGLVAHVLLEFPLRREGFGLIVPPLENLNYSLEGLAR